MVVTVCEPDISDIIITNGIIKKLLLSAKTQKGINIPPEAL